MAYKFMFIIAFSVLGGLLLAGNYADFAEFTGASVVTGSLLTYVVEP